MKHILLTPFFVLLLLLILIPGIPKAHASIPIYVTSTEKDCTTTPCTATALNTNAGDTIMISIFCFSSTGSIGTTTDTLLTTFTTVNSLTLAQTSFSSYTILTGTSSGGSDTVTVNQGGCSGPFSNRYSFTVDIYRFVTGIGVTNANFGAPASGSGSDTLSMIIQPNSFIYEAGAANNANSNCPVNTGSSGQTIRDTIGCATAGGNVINGIVMDRQYSNGGSTPSTFVWTATASSSTFFHLTVELLASGGSVTQVSNCYGNCGSPAVTRTNTNSTKTINFNLTQTFFYENQILFPALILNESASVACTYGTAQCPNANTLILSLYVTASQCVGAVPFTNTCPGTLVFQSSVVNPVKGLFTIKPNYSVFGGQWIALAFSASRDQMQINDTNTAVNIFNTPGTPSSLSQATAQGTSKANVYAWATGNTVTGGGITPAPTVCINTDFACFMIASACALTPSNCFIGGAVYLFIYFVVFVSGVSIAIAYVNREYEYEIHLPPALFFLFFLLELFMFTAMGLIPQYVTIVIFLFTALGVAGYFGSAFAGRSNKSE